MNYAAAALLVLPLVPADGLPTGTWVRRAQDGVASTMIIEAAGSGQKLTLKVGAPGGGTSTMVHTTQYDGKDGPVLLDGKPTGQSMAIRRIDAHHYVNVLKMNGNPLATQDSELSADGKTITTKTSYSGPAGQKTVEYWDKK